MSRRDFELLDTDPVPEIACRAWGHRRVHGLRLACIAGWNAAHRGQYECRRTAAYGGDKRTAKAWADILELPYVTQDIVAPSARAAAHEGKIANLKADLRCYTHAGRIQLIAARF